jgi:hypothetical protein
MVNSSSDEIAARVVPHSFTTIYALIMLRHPILAEAGKRSREEPGNGKK